MTKRWTQDEILRIIRGYQTVCVLAAGAELHIFDVLAKKPLKSAIVARRLRCDLRAVTVLLDALAALGFLVKRGALYVTPQSLAPFLTEHGRFSVLPMIQHQANCLRRWAQLAHTVKSGKAAERRPSVRGEKGDTGSFIGAMHVINESVADRVIQHLRDIKFSHLLDVGGASGTWTMTFLRANPQATATLFDLPQVIPLAKRRLTKSKLIKRVTLTAGNFYRDRLPKRADLAWVSAIVHQNSRAQNRALFKKVFKSLLPGGYIAIRDIVMEPNRTAPVSGALFAVNMLVGTPAGGTFTFRELREDLESAGFRNVRLQYKDQGMNSLIVAQK